MKLLDDVGMMHLVDKLKYMNSYNKWLKVLGVSYADEDTARLFGDGSPLDMLPSKPNVALSVAEINDTGYSMNVASTYKFYLYDPRSHSYEEVFDYPLSNNTKLVEPQRVYYPIDNLHMPQQCFDPTWIGKSSLVDGDILYIKLIIDHRLYSVYENGDWNSLEKDREETVLYFSFECNHGEYIFKQDLNPKYI